MTFGFSSTSANGAAVIGIRLGQYALIDTFSNSFPFNCLVIQFIDAIAQLLSLGASNFMLIFIVLRKQSAEKISFDAALGISNSAQRLLSLER